MKKYLFLKIFIIFLFNLNGKVHGSYHPDDNSQSIQKSSISHYPHEEDQESLAKIASTHKLKIDQLKTMKDLRILTEALEILDEEKRSIDPFFHINLMRISRLPSLNCDQIREIKEWGILEEIEFVQKIDLLVNWACLNLDQMNWVKNWSQSENLTTSEKVLLTSFARFFDVEKISFIEDWNLFSDFSKNCKLKFLEASGLLKINQLTPIKEWSILEGLEFNEILRLIHLLHYLDGDKINSVKDSISWKNLNFDELIALIQRFQLLSLDKIESIKNRNILKDLDFEEKISFLETNISKKANDLDKIEKKSYHAKRKIISPLFMV